MILLPDNFIKPSGISWTYQARDWTTNTYTTEQWNFMEIAGAVFLPACETYAGSGGALDIQYCSSYWSCSCSLSYSRSHAYYLYFNYYQNILNDTRRYRRCSVRLVQDL